MRPVMVQVPAKVQLVVKRKLALSETVFTVPDKHH
jgi:hypothetical protein